MIHKYPLRLIIIVAAHFKAVHWYIFAGNVDKAGDTPFALSYKGGHLETIKYLAQEHQCDPKCMCMYILHANLSSTHNLLVFTVAVNETGDTPLSIECSRGNLEMVKALINKHVDPKSKCLSVHGCYLLIDDDLLQSQSTRLVTPHSLWPIKVDTGKWLNISPSLITVILKVNLIYLLVCIL